MEKLFAGLFSSGSTKTPASSEKKSSPTPISKSTDLPERKHRSNSIHTVESPRVPIPTLPKDDKTIEHFKLQNLSREKFSYEILSEICWWPDEILIMLEILRISYTDFINSYTSNSSIFDVPIRKAVFFMHQSKYNNVAEISKYLKNGNYEIQDNYFNRVICEDNCRMYELEDHKRSANEQKHYYLARALAKLLTFSPLSEGDMVLAKEYEDLVRNYVCLYTIKNLYAVIDDTLRNVLKSAIDNVKLGISLDKFFHDIILDLDKQVCKELKHLNDDQLFTRTFMLKDLLLFAQYSTAQFNFVYNFKRDMSKDSEIHTISQLTPMESYSPETNERIQYVYKYYLSILRDQYNKESIILENPDADYETIVEKTNQIINRPRVTTPRYLKRIDTDKSYSNSGAMFTVEMRSDRTKTRALKHMRKSSVDVLMGRRKSFKMHYNSEGTAKIVPSVKVKTAESISEQIPDDRNASI